MNFWIVFSGVLIAFVFVFIIKQWFDYKKIAVKTKGYPVTTGVTFLFLGFTVLLAFLSLPNYLNTLLNYMGILEVEASKLNEYKEWALIAYLILAGGIVLILEKGTKTVNITQHFGRVLITYLIIALAIFLMFKKGTKNNVVENSVVKNGISTLQVDGGSTVNITQHFNPNPSESTSFQDHLVEEAKRKNKEIDELKEKQEKNISLDEKIHLSARINELKAEKEKQAEQIKILNERLKEYSHDVKMAEEVNKIFQEQGIDAALDYLEKIDFNKALEQVQEKSLNNAKTLLIQASLYAIKNQHKKAEESYLMSLQFKRYVDNTLAYTNYLYDQNQFDEMVRQLTLLKLENTTLTQEERAQIEGQLAGAYQKNNHWKKAEIAYDESLNICRGLAKENPSTYQPYVATTLNNLANLYSGNNRLREAETAYDEALEIRRSLSKENPSAYQPDVAMTLNNLANLYSDNNRLPEAEKAYDEALKIYIGLAKENSLAYKPDVAMTRNNLAILYRENNSLSEAEKAYDEALNIYRDLVKENPSAYQPYVAMTLNNLAFLYRGDNRLREAETAYDEALDIYRVLSKENPSAYGLNLTKILVIGVVLLNQPKENLTEARAMLSVFKGIPQADDLLSIISQLEEK